LKNSNKVIVFVILMLIVISGIGFTGEIDYPVPFKRNVNYFYLID